MKRWMPVLLVFGIVAAIGGAVLIARNMMASERARQEEERQTERSLTRATEELSAKIKAAGDEGVASMARSNRKLELEGKTIGGGRLSPDEATELQLLREREAKERIARIGKDK